MDIRQSNDMFPYKRGMIVTLKPVQYCSYIQGGPVLVEPMAHAFGGKRKLVVENYSGTQSLCVGGFDAPLEDAKKGKATVSWYIHPSWIEEVLFTPANTPTPASQHLLEKAAKKAPLDVVKIGDEVQIISNRTHHLSVGSIAKVAKTYGPGRSVLLSGMTPSGNTTYQYVSRDQFKKVQPLRALTPQALTVLKRIMKGKRLSRLTAMHNYNIQNITARICELRKHGIEVKTLRKKDERGCAYGEYYLNAPEILRVRAWSRSSSIFGINPTL